MENTTAPSSSSEGFPTSWLVVLIVLACAVIGGLVYLYNHNRQLAQQAVPTPIIADQSTAQSTAGWTTISGPSYALKIPPTWKENPAPDTVPNRQCFTSEAGGSFPDTAPAIPGSADFCAQMLSAGTVPDLAPVETQPAEAILIGGMTGEKRSAFIGEGDSSAYALNAYLVAADGTQYSFDFYTRDLSMQEEWYELFTQMLSTFTLQ